MIPQYAPKAFSKYALKKMCLKHFPRTKTATDFLAHRDFRFDKMFPKKLSIDLAQKQAIISLIHLNGKLVSPNANAST